MRSRTAYLSLLVIIVAALSIDEIDAAANPAREDLDRSSEAAPTASMTTIETPLNGRAGESLRKIVRLGRGTPVDIVGQKGRWLEVRASGKRGWVPRSTVQMIDDEGEGDRPRRAETTPAAGPRERSGFRAHTAVRAGAARRSVWMDRTALVEVARAGAARPEPSAKSPPIFEVAVGTELRLAGQARDEWSLVESPDGTVGWLPAATLRAATRGGRARAEAAAMSYGDTTASVDAAAAVDREPAAPPGPSRALRYLTPPSWIRARAAVGVSAFDMVEASYLTTDSLAVEGSYQYGWSSTDWDGQSPRQPDVTSAERTDHGHLLLLALRFEL
jgi:SH3-like domain-containing protein